MDRYRVAPARPVFLSSGASHHQQHRLQPPAGRRSGGAEMELDIFTAERYFNAADAIKYGAAHADVLPPPVTQQLAADVAAASQSGRTAASSEASWNSRSGLLASNLSSAAVRQQHDKIGFGTGGNGIVQGATRDDDRCHRGGKKRWGLFTRDCPCAGRKAVTVDVASEPTTPRRINHHAHARIDALQERSVFKANGLPAPSPNDEPGVMKIVTTGSCDAFPPRANSVLAQAPNQGGNSASSFPAFPSDVGRRVVSSSGSGFTFPVIIGPAVVDEPPRESLEVFRPIDEDSVVLVDPPPPALGAAGFLRATADDDAMSDASSDLFDLESFAASSSYPTTYRGGRGSRRNSREDDDHHHLAYAAAAAEPALSECGMYAPSEASVVWSVATAEGVAYDAGSVANFSSAASACCADDFRFVPLPQSAAAGHDDDGFTAAMSRSAGRKKGGGGGFLNSCRCEKAVSVGPTPVRVARPPVVPAKTTASRAMGLESGAAARYHNRRVHMPVRT